MLFCFCVLCIYVFEYQFGRVVCDNTTSKYVPVAVFKDRHSRFLTFNTKDDSLKVELEFSVPFITVPVKKAWDYASGNVANINMGAVIITGGMILVSTIFVPAALQLFLKKMPSMGQRPIQYRGEDAEVSDFWRIVYFLDQTLIDNNIDARSCMQRAVCWTVKSSSSKVSSGNGSSNDKIIDGLATNDWIAQYMEGTALESAVMNGLSRLNCSKEYGRCKITQRSIHNLAKQFVKALNVS